MLWTACYYPWMPSWFRQPSWLPCISCTHCSCLKSLSMPENGAEHWTSMATIMERFRKITLFLYKFTTFHDFPIRLSLFTPTRWIIVLVWKPIHNSTFVWISKTMYCSMYTLLSMQTKKWVIHCWLIIRNGWSWAIKDRPRALFDNNASVFSLSSVSASRMSGHSLIRGNGSDI